MSSLGTLFCDTINWPKTPAYAHSTAYRQSGRNGNGHVGGVIYGDATTLTSTHFLNNMTEEKALLDEAKALCNTYLDVLEDVAGGGSVTTSDVFVESFKLVKRSGCAGPGGTGYTVKLEFVVYMPVET